LKKFIVLSALPLILSPVLIAWSQNPAPSPTLVLEDCRIRAGEGFPGIKALCGTFERPENPADPGSDVLELFVAVVPALNLEPDPDPLVPIAGGPGQASTEFYAGTASAFEAVRRNRDIVLLDQRGTGRSAPMKCAADDDIIEGRFSREETIAQTRACLDALPHDPRFFTTSVAVEDLEALRIALGYDQFNIYGISYGTRVAQHFLRRYPASTRTVVLDGVVAPQIVLGPAVAMDAQNVLDSIFDRCAENEQCSKRFPTIRNDFKQLRERLAEEPARVTMANPVTGQSEEARFGETELAGALRLLSYHPNSVALMPLLIDEAVHGNYAPLAAQFSMIAQNMANSLNIGMHNAVVCTEDAPYFQDTDITRDQLDATYIGPLQLDALDAICSVWPRGVMDDEFKVAVATDIPVLLLSGDSDPITPPSYADLAAVDLGNALHLTGKKQGHGQAPRGCVSNIIADFIDAASIEGLATECMGRLHAMPFFLDFSGPSP